MTDKLKEITQEIKAHDNWGVQCGSIEINGEKKSVTLFLVERKSGKLVNVNTIGSSQEALRARAVQITPIAQEKLSTLGLAVSNAYFGRFQESSATSYRILNNDEDVSQELTNDSVKELLDQTDGLLHSHEMITASTGMRAPEGRAVPHSPPKVPPSTTKTSRVSPAEDTSIAASVSSKPAQLDAIGPGLPNLGSTCYLNAALQLLMASGDFRAALRAINLNEMNIKNINTRQQKYQKWLIIALKRFVDKYEVLSLKAVIQKEEKTQLNEYVEQIWNSIKKIIENESPPSSGEKRSFEGQQDTTEAIDVITEAIEAALPKNSEHVPIAAEGEEIRRFDWIGLADSRLSEGASYTRENCLGRVSAIPKESISINIEKLMKKENLPEAFLNNSHELKIRIGLVNTAFVQMEVDGQMQRVRCNGQKMIKIKELPETLSFYSGIQYELTGIIVHRGPYLHSGHYVTIRKGLVDGEEKWINYNDSDISKQYDTLNEVMKTFRKYITPYVLLYRKKSSNK